MGVEGLSDRLVEGYYCTVQCMVVCAYIRQKALLVWSQTFNKPHRAPKLGVEATDAGAHLLHECVGSVALFVRRPVRGV